jgi:hypothetical protein
MQLDAEQRDIARQLGGQQENDSDNDTSPHWRTGTKVIDEESIFVAVWWIVNLVWYRAGEYTVQI